MNASTKINRLLHYRTYKTLPKPTNPILNEILHYLKSNNLRKAVSILFTSPEPLPYSLYAHCFQICSSTSAIVEARKLESHLITFSPNPPPFLLNRAIECYSKCGCLNDAKELFDEMPQRDGGSWNAIITGYARRGDGEKAITLFSDMNSEGVPGNEITFASVLGCCGSVLEVGLTKQVHGLVVKYGFNGNVILESSLVDVYGKCGFMNDSRRMFNEIRFPNLVSWNVIVRRYLEIGDGKSSVFMFFKMLREGFRPLNYTFSTALIACSSLFSILEGNQIHGVSVKLNIDKDEVVSSSLLDMYVKCGELEKARRFFDQLETKSLITWTSIVSGYSMSGQTGDARELFDDMPERNVVSYNAMLAGYIRNNRWDEAFQFVVKLLADIDIEYIDNVTLGLILNVCSGLSDVETGKQVHGFIYRHGFGSNIFVGNALVNMYGKCGNLKSARSWFHEMGDSRDGVSWNALLTSYARHGLSERAMSLFRGEMPRDTRPSKFTFGTLLAACANIFALEQGKQIHAYMIRNAYDFDVVVNGALVDMYCKCRCVDYALTVFELTVSRDLVLWNSMIFGLCHNGKGKEVLELIGLMDDGCDVNPVKPDHVTFQGVLLACVFERNVELGNRYFNSMSSEYFVIPRLEHYECMIELYCRCGSMYELADFLKSMPFDPTGPMLNRVLDACERYGFARLGDWVAGRLNELND